jgi:hypothetical protein
MPNLTTAEARSLGTVNQGRTHVNRISHDVTRNERHHRRAQERLTALERENPMITRPDLHHTSVYWMLFLCMLGAYVLDAVLFAPAIDEITGRTLGGNPLFLWVARLAIPAVIVGFETTIGTCRHRAMDHTYRQLSARALWLGILGLALALVMPGAVAWTQLATFLANPDADQWDLYMLIIKIGFLTVLSLVVHSFLVFGGRDAAEAKSYVFGRFQHRRLTSQSHHAEDAAAHSLSTLHDTFTIYDTSRVAHNIAFPHLHQEAGPFSAETIDLLDRGRGVQPAPTQRQPSTQHGPPPTPPPVVDGPPSVPPAGPTPDSGLHGNESEVTPF